VAGELDPPNPPMPISIDDFEALPDPDEGTNAERVLRFLADHDETAFTADELAEKAHVDENSIHAVLGRLREDGLVEHRRPYWALGDDDIDEPEDAGNRIAERRRGERGPPDRED
jgi:DNA-binding transcriptional ArsR family regulator